MTKRTLPTISLLAADSDQAFVRSLHEYGFAALTDHPLEMTRVHKIYQDWQAFFNSDAKFPFQFNKETQDGYFGLADAESAKGSEVQDFKEYFHFYPSGQCPSDLRDDLLTYYQAAEDFAKTLLIWVERHSPLTVSAGYLEPLSSMIDASRSSLLRILHYPAVRAGMDLPRASAHEDINLLTVHVNGKAVSNYQQTETTLSIETDVDTFELRIENTINPKDNSSLEATTW